MACTNEVTPSSIIEISLETRNEPGGDISNQDFRIHSIVTHPPL